MFKGLTRYVAVLSVGSGLLAPMAARADTVTILFGERARSLGMGGARVAVDDRPEDAVLNPAMLAGVKGFHVGWPTIGVDGFEGPSLSDIANRLNSITNTTSGNKDYSALTEIFANRVSPSTLAASTEAEIGYGNVMLTLLGQARALGSQDFITGVPAPAPAPAGSSTRYQVQVGYAFTPIISYGIAVKNPMKSTGENLGPLRLGANLRLPTGTTFRRTFDITRNGSGGVGSVTEVKNPNPFGPDPSTQTSFGLDLGLLVNPVPKLTYGLTIDDAVTPSLPGQSFQTVVSTGVAYHFHPRLLLAADLDNLTSAYGGQLNVRAGAEWAATRHVKVRGGFSSQGVTVGLGLWGVDFAFSPQFQKVEADLLHF